MKRRNYFNSLLLIGSITFVGITGLGEKAIAAESAGMTNNRIDELVRKIDKNTKGKPGFWQFTVENMMVTIVTDEKADRMRIIIPVIEAKELDEKMMRRLLQANFDSALDARYSIARGVLWSAYIHPLSTLDDQTLLSAIGQVVNLTATYGSSFSSGALMFNGGDSGEIQRRKVIDELIRKGMAT